MAMDSSAQKRRLQPSPLLSKKKNKNSKSMVNPIEPQRLSATWHSIQRVSSDYSMQMSSCIVTATEMTAFFRLLDEDQHIFDFLNYDACCRLADKYLLAMAFVYFKRSGLKIREYSRLNFFVALYLAHDMEEDEEELKLEILYWALGHHWQWYVHKFLQRRDLLWKRMNFRAIVSCRMCQDLISLMPSHHAWQRHRPQHHAGAVRSYGRGNQTPSWFRNPFATPPICRLCLPLESDIDVCNALEGLSDLADSSQIPCSSSSKDFDLKPLESFEWFTEE